MSRMIKARGASGSEGGAVRRMSRGVCFESGVVGKMDLSFRSGDWTACSCSSESVPRFRPRSKRVWSERMKPSRRWPYDVERVGTARESTPIIRYRGTRQGSLMRRTQAVFRMMCSIFSSAVAQPDSCSSKQMSRDEQNKIAAGHLTFNPGFRRSA